MNPPPIMHQDWKNLLFLHWPYPAAVVRALIPDGLDLDTFDGRAWVGLVPFAMEGIRAHGLPPVPGTDAFLELNVRTYVSRGGEPGVWFFSLDAAHSLAVRAARLLFHLPYFRARMSEEREGARTLYRSERLWPEPVPATCQVDWESGDPLPPSQPGELAWFLTERYCLYARRRDGTIVRGRVRHPQWPLRQARLRELSSGMLEAAGLPSPQGQPLLHYSEGVSVEIWPVASS